MVLFFLLSCISTGHFNAITRYIYWLLVRRIFLPKCGWLLIALLVWTTCSIFLSLSYWLLDIVLMDLRSFSKISEGQVINLLYQLPTIFKFSLSNLLLYNCIHLLFPDNFLSPGENLRSSILFFIVVVSPSLRHQAFISHLRCMAESLMRYGIWDEC